MHSIRNIRWHEWKHAWQKTREPTQRDVASLFHKRKLFRARGFRKDFVAWNDVGFQEKTKAFGRHGDETSLLV